MNILLVYPEYPDTFWSFKHALKFISKRAANIPLGLITLASLLPEVWNKKLVDLNVSELEDNDILWADFVFVSAMSVQRQSAKQIIGRCNLLGTKTVAGGPLFTEEFKNFDSVDYLVLNEAEITLSEFISDVKSGDLKRIYQTTTHADITLSPVPDYSLLNLRKYASVGIQYSRGCPFDCEFCDITALYGRKVRTKSSVQVIKELDALLHAGWRGGVFFVDDNFIGNTEKLKRDLLPKLSAWMNENNKPFHFYTEASVNLSDDKELMQLMVNAGFNKVFVGIETPSEEGLIECNKTQNNKRNLIQCVQTIQRSGMEVTAGFIVGFDSDPLDIFQKQADFIKQSGIVTAMVGLLNAPRLSKLYKRLHGEGRIIEDWGGDNTNYSMNFTPVMDRKVLMAGYQKILHDIYSSKSYYSRVRMFLKQYEPLPGIQSRISFDKLFALLKSIFYIGIIQRNRKYYWNLMFWSLFKKPGAFPLAVTYSIFGYHFRKVFKGIY